MHDRKQTVRGKVQHVYNVRNLGPIYSACVIFSNSILSHTVAVNISNEGMINETLESEVIHYVLTIPYLGVTIQVCAIDGIVQVYGSVTYSNPNSALNNCSLLLDNTECQNVYIPPNKNSTPGHVKRSVEYQTSTENVLYITVEGASIGNNSFTMNMTEGDIPDDCVGERVATDCESITQNGNQILKC